MNNILTAILDNDPHAVLVYNNSNRKILYQNSVAKFYMQLFDAYDILDDHSIDSSFLAYIEKQTEFPINIQIKKEALYSLDIIKKQISDNEYILYIADTSKLNQKLLTIQSERDMYKDIMHNSPSAVCLFEWDGITIKPVMIGESLVKIIGYPDDVIMKKNFNDFIKLLHSEDIFKFTSDVKNALYETRLLKSIYRLYNKPMNAYRYVLIEAVFVPQPNGHTYINCSFTDVHDEKEKSKELQEINNEIKLLYEHIPGAIFTFKYNKYYSLMYANEEFYSYLGYNSSSFKKLCNNRISEIILDEDKDNFSQLIRSRYASHSKKHITLELRLKTFDGSYKWFSLSGQIMEDSDGNPYCYFVFLDINEYKQIQLKQRKDINAIQNVLDTVQKGIIRYDESYNILFANYYASKYLGYANIDELMAVKNFKNIFSDIDSFNSIINSTTQHFVKINLLNKDGSTKETSGCIISDNEDGSSKILLFNK